MKIELETIEEIQDQIWRELSRACKDRHHQWRTPVLASVSQDGQVNARTVVLRAVDIQKQELTIFTDARSPKVLECELHPDAIFVFWSKKLNWQLRIQVQVRILKHGDELISIWNRIKNSNAAQDYMSRNAPGSPITEPSNPDLEDPSALSYFTILKAQVKEIDWLELSQSGHRRAKITGSHWCWLTP